MTAPSGTGRLQIERLAIRLRGVSRDIAEAALDGLGEELGRRLARTPLSTMPTGSVFRIDLTRQEVSGAPDIAALRSAIAGRLVAGLTEQRVLAEPPEDAP
jgi:hypothetical protein